MISFVFLASVKPAVRCLPMSPTRDNPTKKPLKAAALIRSLENRIHKGLLAPGDALPPEKVLEREFGVSRTVVREALQSLKGRGLVEGRRGSGTYVSVPHASSLRDSLSSYASLQSEGVRFVELMDLRLLIETESARRVATGSHSLAEIRDALALMEGNVDTPTSFADADIAFHLAVIKTSGHKLFHEVAQGLLNARALSFARSTHSIDPKRAAIALREHRRIMNALNERDPGAAVRAMQSHLRRSLKNLLRTLERGMIDSPSLSTRKKSVRHRKKLPRTTS